MSPLYQRPACRRRLSLPRRFVDDRSGQALVEFTIVAPVLVMILLFTIWLWELGHAKLKVQEAARYAAWETTGIALHDYTSTPGMQFASFTFKVTAGISKDASERYADLDVYHPKGGNGMMMARIKRFGVLVPPSCGQSLSVMRLTRGIETLGAELGVKTGLGGAIGFDRCGNEIEELIYGGQAANLTFMMASAFFDLLLALSYTADFGDHGVNYVAAMLMGSVWASDMGTGGGMGAGTRSFGSPDWAFNRRGYIKAYADLQIRNDWFNASILGKPIFGTRTIDLSAEHSLLADSWKLHEGAAIVPQHGLKSVKSEKPGSQMQAQLDRMYFMNPRTRSVAREIIVKGFKKWMDATASATGVSDHPLDEDEMFFAAAAIQPYGTKDDKPQEGTLKVDEDDGEQAYHTLPFLEAYEETWTKRGSHFMGCQQPEQLGCTPGMAQENPFGDYIVTENR